MREQMSREELTHIIDGVYLQIVWVWLCIDSLEAMKCIEQEKYEIAKNFFYITHSSLIYRYTMELAKLLCNEEECSLNSICNLCSTHLRYFDESFDVKAYCRLVKKEIKKHSTTVNCIIKRRNITLAHNDLEYYLFSKKAITEFPLNFDEIKEISTVIYNFAKTMQERIGSARAHLGYPPNSDDVKRLFGEKTTDDLLLEENIYWRG